MKRNTAVTQMATRGTTWYLRFTKRSEKYEKRRSTSMCQIQSEEHSTRSRMRASLSRNSSSARLVMKRNTAVTQMATRGTTWYSSIIKGVPRSGEKRYPTRVSREETTASRKTYDRPGNHHPSNTNATHNTSSAGPNDSNRSTRKIAAAKNVAAAINHGLMPRILVIPASTPMPKPPALAGRPHTTADDRLYLRITPKS